MTIDGMNEQDAARVLYGAAVRSHGCAEIIKEACINYIDTLKSHLSSNTHKEACKQIDRVWSEFERAHEIYHGFFDTVMKGYGN